MVINQTAASLFHEYKMRADTETGLYSHLRTTFPTSDFPKVGARVEKLAALAEVWGKTATALCGGKVDYLEQWRTGGKS